MVLMRRETFMFGSFHLACIVITTAAREFVSVAQHGLLAAQPPSLSVTRARGCGVLLTLHHPLLSREQGSEGHYISSSHSYVVIGMLPRA